MPVNTSSRGSYGPFNAGVMTIVGTCAKIQLCSPMLCCAAQQSITQHHAPKHTKTGVCGARYDPSACHEISILYLTLSTVSDSVYCVRLIHWRPAATDRSGTPIADNARKTMRRNIQGSGTRDHGIHVMSLLGEVPVKGESLPPHQRRVYRPSRSAGFIVPKRSRALKG